jgi:hypothetical protein
MNILLILFLLIQSPGRQWTEVAQADGGVVVSVDKASIKTVCPQTKRCWVRVKFPNGRRVEAYIEVIHAKQARTLGERVYDERATVVADRTADIEANTRSRPFADIRPGEINEAVWRFLFKP